MIYIDAHIREKLSLNDLADLTGYSPFYLSKLFSESMGMPVTSYIRIRKLQHAVVSLLNGYKVIDVAFMYSFDSHEGFTRSFRQLFGSTPSIIKKHITSYKVPHYAVPTKNGRGIPLSKDLTASKVVLDKILAGSPITNAEYSQMGDFIQADLQTANSMCEMLKIIVNRDGSQFQQDYIRGVAQHDLYISDSVRSSGTEVVLKADMTIFGNIAFSQEMLCDWLKDNSTDIVDLKTKVYVVE